MHEVVYSPEAEAQHVGLFFHIAAAASPEIAHNYTAQIVNKCESLRTFPERGTLHNDIRPGLRTFGFRKRVSIAFEVSAGVVTILGVFYGGQSIEEAFEE